VAGSRDVFIGSVPDNRPARGGRPHAVSVPLVASDGATPTSTIREEVMRKIRGWTGLWASVIALGFVVAAERGAVASAISGAGSSSSNGASSTLLSYDSVNSWIDPTGITGDSKAIQIVPVTGASFLAPSSLSLGSFQTKALDSGQSVTYNQTPFHFKFTADTVNGQVVQPNQTPIDVTGVLNGTLSGANSSSVTATFDKPSTGNYTFLTGLYSNTLTVPDSPLTIVPSTTNNGQTTAQAILSNSAITSPVPEPSSVLVFAAAIVGLGLRQQIRRGRLPR
jgi:hypothetical protein